MNKGIIGGVVIVGGILVFALFVLPMILTPAHGLDIVFIDEEGNKIPMAFMNPGEKIVTGFSVRVWWIITGTNIDPSTISIDGELKVSLTSVNENWVTLDTTSFAFGDAGQQEGDYDKTYTLSTLLANYLESDYLIMGWYIMVESSVTASMDDTEGNVLDPQTVTDVATFLLTWYEGSFSLEAGVEVTV